MSRPASHVLAALGLALGFALGDPSAAWAGPTRTEKTGVSVKPGEKDGVKGAWVTVTESIYEWVADAGPEIARLYLGIFGTAPDAASIERMAGLVASGKLSLEQVVKHVRAMKVLGSATSMPSSVNDGKFRVTNHKVWIDDSSPFNQLSPWGLGSGSFESDQSVDWFAVWKATGRSGSSDDMKDVQNMYPGLAIPNWSQFRVPMSDLNNVRLFSTLLEVSRLASLINILNVGIVPPNDSIKVEWLSPCGGWNQADVSFSREILSQIMELALRGAKGSCGGYMSVGTKTGVVTLSP